MSPVVFISGPLTSSGLCSENVRRACHVAVKLREKGYTPVVPHLLWFVELMAPHAEKFWLEWDMELLSNADIVLRLAGQSSGADAEVSRAKELGIPVIHEDAGGVEFLLTRVDSEDDDEDNEDDEDATESQQTIYYDRVIGDDGACTKYAEVAHLSPTVMRLRVLGTVQVKEKFVVSKVDDLAEELPTMNDEVKGSFLVGDKVTSIHDSGARGTVVDCMVNYPGFVKVLWEAREPYPSVRVQAREDCLKRVVDVTVDELQEEAGSDRD